MLLYVSFFIKLIFFQGIFGPNFNSESDHPKWEEYHRMHGTASG